MRVLVLDDEHIICTGVKQILKEHCPQITEIKLCYDGFTALKTLETFPADIAIIDVRMPKMNGIEFISAAQIVRPSIRFIVLSGYSDFSYAQQFMRLGCRHYLLKPVDYHKLSDAVNELCASLASEPSANKSLTADSDDLGAICRKLLSDIEKPPVEFLNKLGIACLLSGCHVAVFDLVNFHSSKTSYLDDDVLVNFRITKLMDSLKEAISLRELNMFCFKLSARSVCLFSPCDTDYAVFYEHIKQLFSVATFQMNYYLTVGICAYGADYSFSSSVRNAVSALSQRFHRQATGIYVYTSPTPSLMAKQYPYSLENEILDYFRTGNLRNGFRQLNELFEFFSANEVEQSCCHMILKRIYSLTLMFLQSADHKNLIATLPCLDSFELALKQIDIFIDLKEYVMSIYTSIVNIFDNQSNSQIRACIKKALSYLNENYGKPLSINDVASYVNLSTSYFSMVFKEQTGISFSEYLIQLRISHAKKLLESSELKVYEISGLVGYYDYRHFCKQFKKRVGLSPSEYREKVLLV